MFVSCFCVWSVWWRKQKHQRTPSHARRFYAINALLLPRGRRSSRRRRSTTTICRAKPVHLHPVREERVRLLVDLGAAALAAAEDDAEALGRLLVRDLSARALAANSHAILKKKSFWKTLGIWANAVCTGGRSTMLATDVQCNCQDIPQKFHSSKKNKACISHAKKSLSGGGIPLFLKCRSRGSYLAKIYKHLFLP